MTHADIAGLSRCGHRRVVQDDVDRDVWTVLEAEFPGLLSRVHEMRGPGESLHVPQAIERMRDKAMRCDDGVMSLRMLAAVAGVSVYTAWAARKERSRV